ncbi:MAG: hypothetical protein GY797_30305 [Deltaproteobacteria bacterium]|nr:hypothetical protein [Deltaproteobacteria bacterium]
MFRPILNLKCVFLVITLIVIFSVIGCASTQFVPDPDSEKWIGQISGMAKGNLELFIKQTQGQDDLYSVAGLFVMNIETTAGGYGSVTARGRINGKIKNETMKAKIFGDAQVEGTFYQISGKMIGTISKTQAFGTWKITHIEGLHSGKWTAKKVVE